MRYDFIVIVGLMLGIPFGSQLMGIGRSGLGISNFIM